MHLLESDQSMQGNQMTIKEHYKNILNERLFNPNNPIGKIETAVSGVASKVKGMFGGGQGSDPNVTRARAAGVQSVRRSLTTSDGRMPSPTNVERTNREFASVDMGTGSAADAAKVKSIFNRGLEKTKIGHGTAVARSGIYTR